MNPARKGLSHSAGDKKVGSDGADAPSGADEFLTIMQVAEHLQVHDRTVRRWIQDEKLVAHRFNSIVRVARHDLQRFVDDHRR